MTKRSLLFTALILIALFAAACGTIATPEPDEPDAEVAAEAEGGEDEAPEVAVEPTATPVPPTPTPEPPTATPTMIPPTPTPTEAPAEVDQITRLVQAIGNPTEGETLFNATYNTEIGQWACAQCHSIEPDVAGIGPSLWGIPDRAGERVEGQSAYQYVANSILHPQEYIVEGYAEGQQMPPNYEELLNETELYHVIAYLMTLTDE